MTGALVKVIKNFINCLHSNVFKCTSYNMSQIIQRLSYNQLLNLAGFIADDLR